MKLSERFIDLFHRVATGSFQTRKLLTPVGAAVFISFVALTITLSALTDRFVRFPELLPHPFNIIISAPVISTGLFFMIWSIAHFLKVKGTPVPFNPPPTLVTSGPYAHVRNPMLSGIFLLLFGLGILVGSISLVFIYTPLFILLNIIELRTVEEPELEKRFGEKYVIYRKRVPMFFPRAGKHYR